MLSNLSLSVRTFPDGSKQINEAIRIKTISSVYSSFSKDEVGQTRFLTLFISLLVLFGLALAYNATIDKIVERELSHEDMPQTVEGSSETSPEEINELELSPPEDDSNIEKREETGRKPESSEPLIPSNDTKEEPERLPLNDTQEKPVPPVNSTNREPEHANIPPIVNLTDFSNNTDLNQSNANHTIPEVNETIVPVNGTNVSVNGTNVSINDTQDVHIPKPSLKLEIEGAEKLTRGANAAFSAIITNEGSLAKNLKVDWILPDGFVIVSQEDNCVDLSRGESCRASLEVAPLISVALGGAIVDVEVSYEAWRESSS